MLTPNNSEVHDRLSVSRPKKAPPRDFTAAEMATLRRVADTLIPADNGLPSGGGVQKFEELATRAAAILDKTFPALIAVIEQLAPVPQADLWDTLKSLAANDDGGFNAISTLVVGVYLYSDEIKEGLGYPAPHRNPPDFFDAADELSSGILDQVMASDFTYVAAD